MVAMAKVSLVTAAEIDKRLRARRRESEPTHTAPPPSPTRLAYRTAVALLSWFDVAALKAGLGSLDNTELRDLLTGDCDRVFTPQGYRWRLRADVREETVRRLGTPAAVLDALAEVPP